METQFALQKINEYQVDILEIWQYNREEFYITRFYEDIIEDEFNGEDHDDLNIFNNIDERWNTDDMTYQLMFNTCDDDNISRANHKIMIMSNGRSSGSKGVSFCVARHGNFFSNIGLEIGYEENINKWLDADIEFEIGGNRIFMSSIRFLAAMMELISGEKIKYDFEGNRIIIPVNICQFFKNKRIELIKLHFHEFKVRIVNKDEELGDCELELTYGHYNEIMDKCTNKMSTLIIQTSNEKLECEDQEMVKILPMNLLSCFIIIWYVIDTSYFAEDQSLQPTILHAELELDGMTIEFLPYEIQKIKCKNYIGFWIPTNRLKQDKLIELLKEMKQDTNLEFLNTFVNYNRIVNQKLRILWSNIQPNAKIIMEYGNINEGIYTNGMFGMLHTS